MNTSEKIFLSSKSKVQVNYKIYSWLNAATYFEI